MGNFLITGGSGFIGSHLVERLLNSNFNVHVIDSRAGDPHLKEYSNATYHKADITDTSVIQLIQEISPEYIFHLATAFNDKDAPFVMKSIAEVNVVGTINIMEGAKLAGTRKVIFTSTGAVYGTPAYLGIDENHPLSPLTPYGMTKRSAEEFVQLYARLYDIPYTILRLATVYGKRQVPMSDGDFIADLIHKYMHHEKISLHGDGQQSRDFVYIEDVLDVFELCLTKGDNSIFNIGSGHGTVLNELINLLNATFEIHVEPEFISVPDSSEKENFFDISFALSRLDWSPAFNLADGLLETVHYYRRTLRM